MTYERFVSDIAGGESQTVEFKSWIHAKNMRERIRLAVDELIAFANSGGRPSLFTSIEIIKCPEGDVLAISVEANGTIYATSSEKCLKRLERILSHISRTRWETTIPCYRILIFLVRLLSKALN